MVNILTLGIFNKHELAPLPASLVPHHITSLAVLHLCREHTKILPAPETFAHAVPCVRNSLQSILHLAHVHIPFSACLQRLLIRDTFSSCLVPVLSSQPRPSLCTLFAFLSTHRNCMIFITVQSSVQRISLPLSSKRWLKSLRPNN